MKAFRHLLSPKVKFVWTEELSREFALSKVNIIRKIHEGVKMFQVSRTTALVTDWSEIGQSLGLWQKHCGCAGPLLAAKEDGVSSSCRAGLIMMLRVDTVL